MLKFAGTECPTIGRWGRGSVKKIGDRLVRAGFAFHTYRNLAITVEWRITLFFAADNLRPEELVALIKAVNRENKFPSDGSQGNHWHVRYSDIKLRILHKILLNREREFVRLYGMLTNVAC